MTDAGQNIDRLRGRNGRVWRHHLEGRSPEWIAYNYDISRAKVRKILKEVREKIPPAAVVATRDLDLDRLDVLLPAFFAQALDGDKDALRSVLSIMERRAKLLGLDSPVQIAGEQTVRYVIEGLGEQPSLTAQVVSVEDDADGVTWYSGNTSRHLARGDHDDGPEG